MGAIKGQGLMRRMRADFQTVLSQFVITTGCCAGLGLAVAREFVPARRGRLIFLESPPGVPIVWFYGSKLLM